jgi:Ca2+-binding EF-hand superfamily protein
MMFALGAASIAIDGLKSLTSSASPVSASTGFGQGSTDPFSVASNAAPAGNSAPAITGFTGGGSQISPATMSELLAAQGQSGSTASAPTSQSSALQDLFSQIDGNGDGQISKSEFESALGAGGTNLAQADDVFNKLDANGDGSVSLGEMSKALKGAGGKGGHHHAGRAGGSDKSSDSSSSAASAATSSYSQLEKMFQREAQSISFSAANPSLSLSA